jgi:hypothetical protein
VNASNAFSLSSSRWNSEIDSFIGWVTILGRGTAKRSLSFRHSSSKSDRDPNVSSSSSAANAVRGSLAVEFVPHLHLTDCFTLSQQQQVTRPVLLRPLIFVPFPEHSLNLRSVSHLDRFPSIDGKSDRCIGSLVRLKCGSPKSFRRSTNLES